MSEPSRLAGVALCVSAPEKLAEFYVTYLGMTLTRSGSELRVGYGGQDAYLALRPARSEVPYQHGRNDAYWKIGITVPDVDAAFAQLTRRGLNITQPHQFQDIGYLCHITDPEGFQIELLQHTFEGAPKTARGDPARPLGGGCRIGQVTLRTDDIAPELDHYQRALGMTLLSRQPVDTYGFELYFLAFTNDRPPDADVSAIANRPWLWQRPYTTLEIQHRLNAPVAIKKRDDLAPGFDGLILVKPPRGGGVEK